MKRARTSGGSLTGGTGDVKPQVITLHTQNTGGGISQYAVQRIVLPVARFGSRKNTTTVMEFLSIDWYINVIDVAPGGRQDWAFLSTNTTHITDETAGLDKLLVDIQDPQSIGLVARTLEPSAVLFFIFFVLSNNSSWREA